MQDDYALPKLIRFIVPFISAHAVIKAVYILVTNVLLIYGAFLPENAAAFAPLALAFALPQITLAFTMTVFGLLGATYLWRFKKSAYVLLIIFTGYSLYSYSLWPTIGLLLNPHPQFPQDPTLSVALMGTVALFDILSLIGLGVLYKYYFKEEHRQQFPSSTFRSVDVLKFIATLLLMAAMYAGIAFGYNKFGVVTVRYNDLETHEEIFQLKHSTKYISSASVAQPGTFSESEYELTIYNKTDSQSEMLDVVAITKSNESFTESFDEFDAFLQATLYTNKYTQQGKKQLGSNQWQYYTGSDPFREDKEQLLVLFTPNAIITARYAAKAANELDVILSSLKVNSSYQGQPYTPEKATYTSINNDWAVDYDAKRYKDSQFTQRKDFVDGNHTSINIFHGINTLGQCPDQLAVKVETGSLEQAVSNRIGTGSSVSSKRIDKTPIEINGLKGERYVEVGTNADASVVSPTELYSVSYLLPKNSKVYILSYYVNTSETAAQQSCKGQLDKLETLIKAFRVL